MLALVLLSVLRVSAVALLPHNSIHGFIAARQDNPGLNISVFPEPCQQHCVWIAEIFTECREDDQCRCTEENAAFLAVCVNCIVANSDASSVPNGQATLSEFNSRCTHVMSLTVTFPLTASPTGPNVGSPTTGTSSNSSSSVSTHVHRANKGAIAGGIIGGLALVSLFLYLLHRKRRNSNSLRAERPFSRLKEDRMPLDLVKTRGNVGKA